MEGYRPPRPFLLATLVALAVLVSYASVAGAPFLWDDHHLIFESPLVQHASGVSDFFKTAFFSRQDTEPEGRGYYRPLTMLSLALDYRLHGTNASGFHLTNVLLHAGNALLLLALLRKAGASAAAAAIGAAFWGLAPRLSEAVAWVSGRTDVLAGTFSLLALLLSDKPTWGRRIAAAILLLGGLLSKEAALAGVAAVATLELGRDGRLRARLLALGPMAVALCVYFLLRIQAIGLVPHGSGTPLARRITAAPEALGRYLVALLDPWHPNLQIGHLLSPSLPYIALGVVTFVGVLLLVRRLRRAALHSFERAGIAFAAVALFLVLHLAPLAVNIVIADRFLYLPLAGIALAGTRTAARLAGRLPALLRTGAVAVALLSFGVVTWQRSLIWSDEVDFWVSAYLDAVEENGTAAVELGNVYYRAGLHREAIAVYESYRGPEARGTVRNNTAAALQAIGRYKEARWIMAGVVRRYPRTPKFRLNHALAAVSVGDMETARREIDAALQLYPGYPIAVHMRRHLPNLAQPAATSGNTPEELFTAARHALDRARTLDSVQLLDQAMQMGKPSRELAREAFFLAEKFAEPRTAERIFRAFVAAFDGKPPAALVDAHRLRKESGQRLRAAFPRLKLELPRL